MLSVWGLLDAAKTEGFRGCLFVSILLSLLPNTHGLLTVTGPAQCPEPAHILLNMLAALTHTVMPLTQLPYPPGQTLRKLQAFYMDKLVKRKYIAWILIDSIVSSPCTNGWSWSKNWRSRLKRFHITSRLSYGFSSPSNEVTTTPSLYLFISFYFNACFYQSVNNLSLSTVSAYQSVNKSLFGLRILHKFDNNFVVNTFISKLLDNVDFSRPSSYLDEP